MKWPSTDLPHPPEVIFAGGSEVAIADPDVATLDRAYDPEAFRALGHRMIDTLADHLDRAHAGAMPVLPWQAPAAMLEQWPARFPDGGDVDALLSRVLASSNHLHHPRYFGHQVASPLPLAALCELVGAMLNNGSIYEMGPVAMAMERAVTSWLTRQLGFAEGADGVFTSGGSLGNLTALLAARASHAGFDVWKHGQHVGPPLAVLVSSQSHYSISRAVRILGWGDGGAIEVPVDDRCRMRADTLGLAFERARAAGRRVIAVVATAGSNPTGAYDPLPEIADFCEQRGLWMHVDGAHGAAASLSQRHRHLVAGIERADSVVWDAHKMMMMPSLVTAVLFREGVKSYGSFAQDAEYLFNGSTPWADTCTRTFECTKPMMVLKLYVALSHYGPELLAEYVERMFSLGAKLAALIDTSDDFELALQPESNIVMFRYCPPGVTDLDALQARIRTRLRDDGTFFLVRAPLRDELYLRTCLMNPMSTADDLVELLDAIRQAARTTWQVQTT